jgi:type IV secretory pathway TraG/TraD family ATPase VirD4
MHINQFLRIANPEDNKMLSGISAELSNRVMVFATDMRIKTAFTPTDDDMMKWEDLATHNIFMRIPEDKLGQWDGAITLMLTQLIRTLERRPDMHSREAKERKLPPVLLLLDEFPRLGKVDVIQNAVSTLRSKGVTICLMMQSLAQLDKTYGKESRQIILDNCQYKAIQ